MAQNNINKKISGYEFMFKIYITIYDGFLAIEMLAEQLGYCFSYWNTYLTAK